MSQVWVATTRRSFALNLRVLGVTIPSEPGASAPFQEKVKCGALKSAPCFQPLAIRMSPSDGLPSGGSVIHRAITTILLHRPRDREAAPDPQNLAPADTP